MTEPADTLEADNACRFSPSGKRSAGMVVAAVELAGGATVEAASGRAGVSSRTVYRWCRRPPFKRKLDELRGRLVGEAVGRLSRSMGSAAGVLEALLASADERVRLAAARATLELAVKVRGHDELERRLADLEHRIAGQVGRDAHGPIRVRELVATNREGAGVLTRKQGTDQDGGGHESANPDRETRSEVRPSGGNRP